MKKNPKFCANFCVFITSPKRATGFKTDVKKQPYHTLSPNLLAKANVLTCRVFVGAVES